MNPDFKLIPTFPEEIYIFATYKPLTKGVNKDSYFRLWWDLYYEVHFGRNIIERLQFEKP